MSVAWLGLVSAPAFALICYVALPDQYQSADGVSVPFSPAGKATLAVMVWMSIWWLTEAVHVTVTALLPLVLFPFLGIAEIKQAAAPYAHPLIFLFMGGFLLALSMERWGLGRRLALHTLRLVGTSPRNMIGGFMLVTAVLSGFVSNTATAAMMLPIALSVIEWQKSQNRGDLEKDSAPTDHFATCLMLAIAYSASIGGIATIIGTPPNVFLVSFMSGSISEPYRSEIGFARWMLIGTSLAAVFLPIVFVLLTRVLLPVEDRTHQGSRELLNQEIKKLRKPNVGEWATAIVFAVTIVLWISRPWLTALSITIGDREWVPFRYVSDTGIVMAAAMVLFLVPVNVRERRFVMDWETANLMPWGILLLFGGGLSLAAAVTANGVAEFIGANTGFIKGVPPLLLVFVVTTAVVFLTELTSNTASTASLIPVLAAIAPGLDIHPYLLIVPAALAASCAFMLPVATPPNAIVFGAGFVSIRQMARAGFLLNLVSVALITIWTFLVVRPVLGF